MHRPPRIALWVPTCDKKKARHHWTRVNRNESIEQKEHKIEIERTENRKNRMFFIGQVMALVGDTGDLSPGQKLSSVDTNSKGDNNR